MTANHLPTPIRPDQPEPPTPSIVLVLPLSDEQLDEIYAARASYYGDDPAAPCEPIPGEPRRMGRDCWTTADQQWQEYVESLFEAA
jgi:hypothetical protein